MKTLSIYYQKHFETSFHSTFDSFKIPYIFHVIVMGKLEKSYFTCFQSCKKCTSNSIYLYSDDKIKTIRRGILSLSERRVLRRLEKGFNQWSGVRL